MFAEQIKKLIFIASSILLLAICSGCAFVWKPGSLKSQVYTVAVEQKWDKYSSKYLIKKLFSFSRWRIYRVDPTGKSYRYKIDYYAVNNILRSRINEKKVYEAYGTLAKKTLNESVARDTVRALELTFDVDSKQETIKTMLELYKDKRTHPAARNEILHVLMERNIKVPELIVYVVDFNYKKNETLSVEDLYLRFLKS